MIPVCVFAKPPVSGTVKTRLAAAIGDDAAAGLASAMFCDVWRAVSSSPGVRPILAATRHGSFPIPIPSSDTWLQTEGDLGARLEQILIHALNTAPAAMAIGADSPLLTPHHLQNAVAILETQDAVLGPSFDSGFYLLGLRRCPSGLLSGLPWSHPDTLSATVRRLEENGFSIDYTAPLLDVDTPGDLSSLVASLPYVSSIAPETHAWLVENAALIERKCA